MKFSYNLLSEYFRVKLPEPEKLAELLTMRTFEVEGVEKIGDDYVFDIDILPNRMPDAAGHYFMAREIGAIVKSKVKSPSPGLVRLGRKNSKYQKDKLLNIKIENPDLCSRYIGVVMDGVSVKKSPEWLTKRLSALGLNSINNLVDIANLAMLKTNQPLHIFDFEKIKDVGNPNSHPTGGHPQGDKSQISNPLLRQDFGGQVKLQKKEIIVRNAKKGESIITLDNKKYDLDESVLVIADAKEPLAIAGIKGGKKAEVDFNTKKIIIEAANFNRAVIRKTSQNLNLRTDASIRFSAGLNPALADFGLAKTVSLINEIAGGKVIEISDIYPKKAEQKIINLDFKKAEKLLGEEIPPPEAKKILISLGFGVKDLKAVFKVSVPLERMDIENQEDLIEELGRVFGYEKIIPKSPKINIIENYEDDLDNFLELTRNFFAGQGFNETYNYSFIGEREFSLFPEHFQNEILEIQNPAGTENRFLRPILAPNILRNIGLNLKNFDEARIFEIGKTYLSSEEKGSQSVSLRTEIPISEKWHLGGAIGAKNLNGKSAFYEMKGILSTYFDTLGLEQTEFINLTSNEQNEKFLLFIFTPRSAEIRLNGKTIGVLGEMPENVLKMHEIKNGTVLFFEIDLSVLFNEAEEEREFAPFSRFPCLTRDLSLFVLYNTRIVDVEDIINNTGGKLLFDCDLFDIYEDGKLGGKKSLAFRLIFQSEERTLNDKEVDEIMDRTIKALEEKGWEVRK